MFCPKCGEELKEDTQFCPKCGFDFDERNKNENDSSSTNRKSNSKGILNFLDDWKEWGTGKKIGSIILVCCIGLIIIGAIGGILFPDSNTSEHRFYMTDSSFVIPDDCTIRESGLGASMAILVQKDGTEVYVKDFNPLKFTGGEILDINETTNVDGVDVNKIKYHYNDGLSFTEYYFNKDNIDYCIVFNQETEHDNNMVNSIVKTMDTEHGSIDDHENIYQNSDSDTSNSNSNNNGHEDLYDSYTGSSSSKSNNELNNVEVDKLELNAQQYLLLAYDGTHDYTLNGQKGHLYVGPYHDGGSDVDFFYQKGDKYYYLAACDDADAALEKMATMV